ncbi:hypothetical protein GOV07_00045 [Candidatus Woesearchaeota archaeon]|nr:hypothetical protein [Candidatus Woesearchaeota archaeon]
MDAETEWRLEKAAERAKEEEYDQLREEKTTNALAINNILGPLVSSWHPTQLKFDQEEEVEARELAESAIDRILTIRTALDCLDGRIGEHENEGPVRIVQRLDIVEFFRGVGHFMFPDMEVIKKAYKTLSNAQIVNCDIPMMPQLNPENRYELREQLEMLEHEYLGILLGEVDMAMYAGVKRPALTSSIVVVQDNGNAELGVRAKQRFRFRPMHFSADIWDSEAVQEYALEKGRDVLAAKNVSPYLSNESVRKSIVGCYEQVAKGRTITRDS